MSRKYGHELLPEYRVWRGMRTRTTNPRDRNYPRYGARGIKVCERWQASFEAFLEDMGPRPSIAHQIDRIDNAKGYEPGNCRWATRSEQQRNKTNNRRMTLNGVTLTQAEWCDRLGIGQGTLDKRLRLGWSDEAALTTPPIRGPRRASREQISAALAKAAAGMSYREAGEEIGMSAATLHKWKAKLVAS